MAPNLQLENHNKVVWHAKVDMWKNLLTEIYKNFNMNQSRPNLLQQELN
jgi:hypothetical protein